MNFIGGSSKEDNGVLRVAFDCDGTLIDLKGEPRPEVIDIFNKFQALGCVTIIWSGGGEDYAKRIADKLGLAPDCVRSKSCGMFVDIAFDDVGMGPEHCKVCIRV